MTPEYERRARANIATYEGETRSLLEARFEAYKARETRTMEPTDTRDFARRHRLNQMKLSGI